jgi:hypothetical protein
METLRSKSAAISGEFGILPQTIEQYRGLVGLVP